MTSRHKWLLLKALHGQDGQVLPWVALTMILFLGMSGLTLDLGHAYVCYRELQASTDAAAMAGARAMAQPGATVASVTAEVQNFSSQTGGANVNPNLPQAVVTPAFSCSSWVSTNLGVPCNIDGLGYNAIQVTQTTVVPTMFVRVLSLFGVRSASSITLESVATASVKGAGPAQYNVAMVVDTTASMGSQDSDANCGNTRIYCALQGVQTMLGLLSPCAPGATDSSSCNAYDQVSLFTFPPVQANTAKNDTTCPTSNPTITPYSTPAAGATWTTTNYNTTTSTAPSYQITNYLNDYSSTYQKGAALNTGSALTIATGGGVGTGSGRNYHPCSGMQTPGGDGTYYAGAIYAAASSLVAAQAANPGSINALIILSDGDADSSRITGAGNNGDTYGSAQDQCQQAVQAANYVSGLPNTTVYTIAYGAASSGCASDAKSRSNPNGTGITPCQAMQEMASSSADFYSDATASQNQGQCQVTDPENSGLALNGIFKALTAQFTKSRLIPNSVWGS